MPAPTRRANASKSVIRSRAEHVFADQKSRMGLFIRAVGIRRVGMKIGLANLVTTSGASSAGAGSAYPTGSSPNWRPGATARIG